MEYRSGELLFGTVETWLIWKLTKGRCSRNRLFQCIPDNDVQYQYVRMG